MAKTKKEKRADSRQVTVEIREKMVGYILAALGLVAGLAWNEAIKELIAMLWPMDQNTLIAKFTYALIMTVLVVVVSYILLKLAQRKEEVKTK